ncbi:MAG: CheR family methyltransferase [Candidatus Alkaliphilus sp. MAG34]
MLAITEREFKQLSGHIKANYGIHLKKEKKSLVTGRLRTVLENEGIKNFSEYYDYIISDKTGKAVTTLVDKITTNHTFFMREPSHFYYFRDNVMPFLEKTVKDKDLRIWCAACATGEESYTLAMIMDEFFGRNKGMWDTKILATDISAKVLDVARRGIYNDNRIMPLPPAWRMNYLKKIDDENYIISDKIKNEVIYRKFNLMEETFPFRKKFHVIFCRNVMIYFDRETRNELIEKFYDMTSYGGYLFIGHSEYIDRTKTKYKYVAPSIYRKE